MKELARVYENSSNYDMRLEQLLESTVGAYVWDAKLNMFEEFDFAFVLPYIVKAGATIQPGYVNPLTKETFYYAILIDEEKEEEFYMQLMINLNLYLNMTFRRSKVTFI